jgi:nitrogen fixation NifU-like protein
MEDLYREYILDHYKSPRFRGHLEKYTFAYEDDNPTCGDHVHMEILVDENGKVVDARFDGVGCALSQASADILLEHIVGKPLEEVKQFSKDDLLNLLGITLGPVRLKCALLSLKVLKGAVYGLKPGESLDEEED